MLCHIATKPLPLCPVHGGLNLQLRRQGLHSLERSRRHAARAALDGNPLELLRMERDPAKRSVLMARLDSAWTSSADSYTPSPVELLLSKELGVEQQSVMLLAVDSSSNPPLCTLDLDDVKASLRALKSANVDVSDIWFLVSKRPSLLMLKEVLQRWLDFLTVYGLRDSDLVNFLQRAPQELLERCTLYQAGQVVSFLKQLGIKNDFLAKRVFAVWPDVLCRDVDAELRPIISFLMQLGVEVSDISAMICIWPELLLAKVDSQLEPFSAYLRERGCSNTQLAEILMICPHLLGFQPEDLFGHRLRSLETLGIGPQDVKAMVAKSLTWLTASGGVQPQVDFLLQGLGLSATEARTLVLAAPQVLAERDIELERKWHFIQGTMAAGKDIVIAHPRIMAVSFMQVLGPRYSFLQTKGRAVELSSNKDCLLNLIDETDEDWCRGVGLPINEFKEHYVHFQTDYNEKISKDAAKEFQEELRKLGIYEGTE